MIGLADDEFIAEFEAGSLAATGFHHEDHVRMAFLYLQRLPVLQAIERFSSGLARFAALSGKPQLYNETVTWAFLLLIRERMIRACCEQTWADFSEQNRDLMTWNDSILKKYYREETLKSDLARRVFLFPDQIRS